MPGTAVPGSYTVRYSAENHKDVPNVLVITPGFGDGDETRWPEQGDDMVLLGQDNEKQGQWRRTAAEVVAKDLGLLDGTHQHWILDTLPTGYGLFQQVTHPKEPASRTEGKSRVRLDRFIYGHNSKKIRSALSLGKHLAHQLTGAHGLCHCDGCKVLHPRASASSMADIGAPLKMAPRKRKRTGEYADLAGFSPRASGAGGVEGEIAEEDEGASSGTGATHTDREGSVATSVATAAGGASAVGSAAASPEKSTRPKRARKSAAKARAAAESRWGGDDDDHYGGAFLLDEDSDYEEPTYAPDIGRVGKRTSSGRRTKPSERLLSGLKQEQDAHALAGLPGAVVDDDGATMTPAGKDVFAVSSRNPREQVEQDLAFPGMVRVGELVWVRVPLGAPPTGPISSMQLSRWPGIVRKRTVVVTKEKTTETHHVELLGMSPKDALESVRGSNVTPWLSYIPRNARWLDENPPDADAMFTDGQKKGWAAIQAEGWAGVAEAFRRAHRIAKAYAAITIRPIPVLRAGKHLAISPNLPPTSLSALQPMRAAARYLTLSHVILGPELIHAGDYVRLNPGCDLDASVAADRSPLRDEMLPTTLVMRIGTIYRGLSGSPLIARGLVFELKPIAPTDNSLDISLMALPQAVSSSMPAPFPLHKWRLLTPSTSSASLASLETEVLFHQAVAGRYFPATLPSVIDGPVASVERVNKYLEDAADGKGILGDGSGSKGGLGEEGIKALGLLLGGMSAGDKTARIEAINGIAGDREQQFIVAEEQAMARPAIPGAPPVGGEAPRPGDEQVTDVAVAV
ncbi:uncharacterized protein JCM10292_003229 [Rhodotorula paludigena]|uniref:uncharacterized protein n=1 Tax=Rhodotorula paludigena TaxID=86838 RepID=UPI0031760528